MSLYLDGVVDPIAAQGARQLDFIPRHFRSVSFGTNLWIDTNRIRNWIWVNYSGRFYVGPRPKVDENNRAVSEIVAAFEDSSEAIMFSFVAPTLKNSDSDIF